MRNLLLAACLAITVLALGCGPARPAPRAPSDEAAALPWGGLTVIERGDPDADAALVLLHDLGAPGDELVGLGEELARRVPRPLRVVIPAGPVALPDGARAWYPVHSEDTDEGKARARVALDAVVATLIARGVPARRIVVGGFSQGGIMTIEVAMGRGPRLAGIAVLSARALSHPPEDFEALSGLRVFQSHGRSDERFPFARGESFRTRAVAAGAQLEHVPFDGGHAIPPEVVSALAAWLTATFAIAQ